MVMVMSQCGGLALGALGLFNSQILNNFSNAENAFNYA